MATGSRSLRKAHPHHYEVPLLLLLAAGLLVLGLSLPLAKVEKMVFWKNEYSVFTGVESLAQQNELMLAGVLCFFSIVFPTVKLGMLGFLWFFPMKGDDRRRMLHWLGILGKWSMLDVFVVAILIVLVKLGPLAKVEPQAGIYVFCLAIFLSMALTMYVTYQARKA